MIKPLLSLKCPKDMPFETFLSQIKYPVGATPKIDGIRARTCQTDFGTDSHTRSLKSIPNKHIRAMLATLPPWLDGELTTGKNFQSVSSGVMSHSGMPDFTYHVFDHRWHEDAVYEERTLSLNTLNLPSWCHILSPRLITTLSELLAYEKFCLENEAEGVMLRPMQSLYNTHYKNNRATFSKPYLVAIKRFDEGEAKVLSLEEAQKNLNEIQQNELGNNFRSSHKDGMLPKGTLGSLLVEDVITKVKFNIGTGFTEEQRYNFWTNPQNIVGKLVKYKWQNHGVKDKPRIPVFLGIRDERDLS